MSKKGLIQKKNNHTRQEFLHTFFEGWEEYEVKEVNGFILEKHPVNHSRKTEVAIYSFDAWNKKQSYLSRDRAPLFEEPVSEES